MKHTLILFATLLFNLALHGQELSSATLQTRLMGYWKGNKWTNDQQVLVINADKSYQFYKNKVKIDYGTLEIDYHSMFRLNFKSHFGEFTEMDYPNGYIWTLPEDKLQFGSSPVDGGDAFFDRMHSNEIDEFWGKKLLSKAIRKQSEQLLLQYFKEWQGMESGSGRQGLPTKELSRYQIETSNFFNDFYSERLKSVTDSKYNIVEISINRIGYADFAWPTELALDSFKNNLIAYESLDNFSPAFSGNKNITFLIIRADRAKVMHACLSKKDKKYRNWLFLKKYLCSEMNGQHDYDFTDTPMIQNLVFNTQQNLAMVEYVSSYAWVKDVYEKKDGKWQFHATMKNKK
jgi:hypothetical protein